MTRRGWVSAERLAVGDEVAGRVGQDPSGEVEWKAVEDTFRRADRVLHLHFPSGELIRTTPEHPFWVEGKGWTAAGALKEGDRLATLVGDSVPVHEVYDTGEWEPVYNVRVADHHTYFVGEESWGFAVWAHNVSCEDVKEVVQANKLQPLTGDDCTKAADLATAKDGPGLYALIRQKYTDTKKVTDRQISEVTKALLALAGVVPTQVTDALDQIAQYRVTSGLPVYQQGDQSTGTVARLQIGSDAYHGSNKVLATRQLTDAQITAMYDSLGLPAGLDPNATQFLWHAEFEALWKARVALGTLPEVLTMYVDRPTCSNCTKYLPYVLKAWGEGTVHVLDWRGEPSPLDHRRKVGGQRHAAVRDDYTDGRGDISLRPRVVM